jgi:integrase
MMLLGEEGRRRMKNKAKTNDQLFDDYYSLITNTHAPNPLYEAKRLLGKFQGFLGGFPPTSELAMKFLNQYKDLKPTTRIRYYFVLSAFFKRAYGEKLPMTIRQPKILPQYVPGEDIDRLIEAIKGKKSHKKSIERDVLFIETLRATGIRRGECANLKVGDLHLDGDDPVLIVRAGKGNKDRAVSLNPDIRDQLADFVKGKSHDDSVFGLAAKTISCKIGQWSKKAGVPHIHAHSIRHYVGTTLMSRGANPRAIQAILGHESLDVTMRYASITGKDIKQAMGLLDKSTKEEISEEEIAELTAYFREETKAALGE